MKISKKEMNSPEYVMIPESGYYEFIPEEDADLSETLLRTHTLEMDQLQPGKKYEMVVTNLSGFYRYRIGDVVTVNGYLDNPLSYAFLTGDTKSSRNWGR